MDWARRAHRVRVSVFLVVAFLSTCVIAGVIVPAGATPAVADGWRVFGAGAADPPKLRRPLAMALDVAGSLYVVDEGYGAEGKDRFVLRFSSAGEFESAWGRELNTPEIVQPLALAIDPAHGTVLVAEHSSEQILRLTPGGEVEAAYPLKGTRSGSRPQALTVDGSSRIYVGYNASGVTIRNDVTEQLQVLSPTGDVIKQWRVGIDGGGRSPSRGEVNSLAFWGLGALAAGPDGTVYYSEGSKTTVGPSSAPTMTGSARLTRFTWNPAEPDAKEEKVGIVGLPHGPAQDDPTGAGNDVTLARGVAVDAAGTVYVSDTKNRRILKVDPATKTETILGGGADSDQFIEPWGIAVSPTGTVYVADAGKQQILVLEQTVSR